jgi:hypothetical protein
VMHEYKGREHLHLVHSRIDENGKAISDSWNYLHHEKAAREIEAELGLEPTQGVLYQAKTSRAPSEPPATGLFSKGREPRLTPRRLKPILPPFTAQRRATPPPSATTSRNTATTSPEAISGAWSYWTRAEAYTASPAPRERRRANYGKC